MMTKSEFPAALLLLLALLLPACDTTGTESAESEPEPESPALQVVPERADIDRLRVQDVRSTPTDCDPEDLSALLELAKTHYEDEQEREIMLRTGWKLNPNMYRIHSAEVECTSDGASIRGIATEPDLVEELIRRVQNPVYRDRGLDRVMLLSLRAEEEGFSFIIGHQSQEPAATVILDAWAKDQHKSAPWLAAPGGPQALAEGLTNLQRSRDSTDYIHEVDQQQITEIIEEIEEGYLSALHYHSQYDLLHSTKSHRETYAAAMTCILEASHPSLRSFSADSNGVLRVSLEDASRRAGFEQTIDDCKAIDDISREGDTWTMTLSPAERSRDIEEPRLGTGATLQELSSSVVPALKNDLQDVRHQINVSSSAMQSRLDVPQILRRVRTSMSDSQVELLSMNTSTTGCVQFPERGHAFGEFSLALEASGPAEELLSLAQKISDQLINLTPATQEIAPLEDGTAHLTGEYVGVFRDGGLWCSGE